MDSVGVSRAETLTHVPRSERSGVVRAGTQPGAVDCASVADVEDPGSPQRAETLIEGTRAQVDEAALVLASQEIRSAIEPADLGYRLVVAAADAPRGRATLDTYRQENPPGRAEESDHTEDEPLADPGLSGFVVAIVLVACHWLAQRQAFHALAYEYGSADAGEILRGEWWRTVSALFLHVDVGHVVGNALFGVYFLTAVTRSLGVGLGLLLVLLSGAIGNGLNAIGHAGDHHSVGASTAVFGAIGILTGMALSRRNRAGLRGARLLVPVGAGLGLLAMLGTSGARVDVFAHLYGLLAGGLLGIGVKLGLRKRPGGPTQVALALLALAIALLSIALALGSGSG